MPADRFLSLFLGLVLAFGSAHACSCIRPPPPAEAREAAAAVFRGKVLTVEPDTSRQWPGRKATVLVDAVWKGDVASETQLFTNASSAACGFPFEVEETYLFYAFRAGDRLSVSLCSRTRAAAAEEAAALGTPKPPLPLEKPAEAEPTCPCQEQLTIQEAHALADRIVHAEVLDRARDEGDLGARWRTRLGTLKSWKQPAAEELTLSTPAEGPCQRKFAPGETRLYFFSGGAESTQLLPCTPSPRLSRRDSSGLFEGEEPVSKYPPGWMKPALRSR